MIIKTSVKSLNIYYWIAYSFYFLLKQIIKISSGQVVLSNPQYYREHEGLSHKEIAVQSYTKVEILGDLSTFEETNIPKIELHQIGDFIGEFVRFTKFFYYIYLLNH